MDWREYIYSDPGVIAGKPVVRGTRLAADFLLNLFASGWTRAEVLDSYPQLSDEALLAVFAFAAEAMREGSFYAAVMNRKPDADELRDEYDFSADDVRGGVRGKYAGRYAQGNEMNERTDAVSAGEREAELERIAGGAPMPEPRYRIDDEGEDLVIRLRRDVFGYEELSRFLDFLELASMRHQGGLSGADGACLVDELDRYARSDGRRTSR